MNLPNKLTLLRILLIPVFVALFYIEFPFHYLAAVAVFAIATLTDFLDGYLARKLNLVTNLGKFLDPIADKVLVSTALIILLTKAELFSAFHDITMMLLGIAVAIILARELIVSGFRMVAASTGIVLAADMIGKWKTVFQDVALIVIFVAASFMESSFGYYAMLVGLGFLAIATVLTIVSGCNYIIKNKEVLKS